MSSFKPPRSTDLRENQEELSNLAVACFCQILKRKYLPKLLKTIYQQFALFDQMKRPNKFFYFKRFQIFQIWLLICNNYFKQGPMKRYLVIIVGCVKWETWVKNLAGSRVNIIIFGKYATTDTDDVSKQTCKNNLVLRTPFFNQSHTTLHCSTLVTFIAQKSMFGRTYLPTYCRS